MKGFKMLSGMHAIHGNGMQYEIGKEYYIGGAPNVCDIGFHFCKTIEDCFLSYEWDKDIRVFEVDTLYGDVMCGSVNENDTTSRVYASNAIKLVQEIPREKVLEYLKLNADSILSKNQGRSFVYIRCGLAEAGICVG